ncbi:MAG: IS1595 family transposase [Candidatus Nanoarchaeia archaeon]|nr:IS1595 family transposase [Candidatus Nanoarchaeia archaeon]
MNLIEINNNFPTELEAIQFFEKARWGKKPKCIFCGSDSLSKRNKDYRFHCLKCDKSFSVTSNTHLHSTRIPLKTWLYAFAIVSDAKKGVSAKQLERNLGIHYETAWNMAHKIRDLMIIENDQIELSGILEMDETYIGGKPRKFNTGETQKPENKTIIPELDKEIALYKEAGIKFKRGKGNQARPDENPKRGRGTDKFKVAGIVQRNGDVIAEVMKNLSYSDLKKLVNKYVDKEDSVMITDEYKGYNKFNNIIEHIRIDHERLYSYKGVNTNSIESFWAIVKRGIIGQYHQVSLQYLPKYIAEFVFKYNNRNNDDMFETLVKNSMIHLKPLNR